MKRPVSVLVLIHSPALDILLLERAPKHGYWQSVTGSQEGDETLLMTAMREVAEETGIHSAPESFVDWRLSNRFEIFAEWRHRFEDGITHNTEHVFSLCVPPNTPVTVQPDEHFGHVWRSWHEAAAACFSWTNRDAILILGLDAQPSVP